MYVPLLMIFFFFVILRGDIIITTRSLDRSKAVSFRSTWIRVKPTANKQVKEK